MKNYDVLVVGAGFAGATIARKRAEQGKKVLVVEKRAHIGGNMYECEEENGIRVHLYGPHIFHTNSERAFQFLKEFGEFFPYEHKVLGKIDGKLVPIPFNYTSLEMLFDKENAEKIKLKLKRNFPDVEKISILDLVKHDDVDIKKFGQYVYDKVFANYTAKQWGTTVDKIDTSVINRVPVVLGYDDRYFKDKFQYMPKEGFTKLFENILNHENIEVRLNMNVKDILKIDFEKKKTYINGEEFGGEIFYTGALDELMNYEYGNLPYRTLELKFENYPEEYYQENSVVNYPNEEEFTRITEFKYLTKQEDKEHTTILKEYPAQFDIHNPKYADPYYPINNDKNQEIYKKYQDKLASISNIKLCGRLAEYKYYNMDAVIDRALTLCE